MVYLAVWTSIDAQPHVTTWDDQIEALNALVCDLKADNAKHLPYLAACYSSADLLHNNKIWSAMNWQTD